MSVTSVFRVLDMSVAEKLVDIGKYRPFVVEKALHVVPALKHYVDSVLEKTTLQNMCCKKWYGLCHLKWIGSSREMKSEFISELPLIVNVKGDVELIKVLDSRIRPRLRPHTYRITIERIMSNAIRFGNVAIVAYLMDHNLCAPNDQQLYEAYVETGTDNDDMRRFLYDCGIKPDKRLFLSMIINGSPLWASYLPDGIDKKTILLTICILGDCFDVHPGLDLPLSWFDCERKDGGLLTERESQVLPLLRRSSTFHFICMEGWVSNADEQDKSGDEPRLWHALRYLKEEYGTISENLDVEFVLRNSISDGDLEGVRYILEDLEWIPEDLSMYMDDVFESEEMTRYIINKFNLYDWDEATMGRDLY